MADPKQDGKAIDKYAKVKRNAKTEAAIDRSEGRRTQQDGRRLRVPKK